MTTFCTKINQSLAANCSKIVVPVSRFCIIGSIAIAAIGMLAFFSQYLPIPYLSRCLNTLPAFVPPATVAMGIILIGLSARLSSQLVNAQKKLRRRKALKEIPEKLNEIQNELIKHNNCKKIYYNFKKKKFQTEKNGIAKIERFTFLKIEENRFFLKTETSIGNGKSKDIRLGFDTTSGEILVLSTEKNAPANYEFEIYNATTSSPYIVHCISQDWKQKNNQRIAVLEYCNQGSFSEFQDIHLDNKKIYYKLFANYARGLNDLHTCNKDGYLHMDLHKGNLFVHQDPITHEYQGKLGDLASSRKIPDLSNRNTFKHFLPTKSEDQNHYSFPLPLCLELISPEIVNNIYLFHYTTDDLLKITAKADIWSLGFTFAMHFMPTSKACEFIKNAQKQAQDGKEPFCPFPLDEDFERKRQVLVNYSNELNLYEKKVPKPNQDQALDLLIWKMLHPNPEIRPTDLEVAEAFEMLANSVV